jgi:hypothetical protein
MRRAASFLRSRSLSKRSPPSGYSDNKHQLETTQDSDGHFTIPKMSRHRPNPYPHPNPLPFREVPPSPLHRQTLARPKTIGIIFSAYKTITISHKRAYPPHPPSISPSATRPKHFPNSPRTLLGNSPGPSQTGGQMLRSQLFRPHRRHTYKASKVL